jgi:hypothetical protein
MTSFDVTAVAAACMCALAAAASTCALHAVCARTLCIARLARAQVVMSHAIWSLERLLQITVWVWVSVLCLMADLLGGVFAVIA